MKPPPSLSLARSTQVCKLLKSIYCLKQAPRQLYSKLSESLVSLGYIQSLNDYSLTFKKLADSIVFVAIYVDDVLVIGNDEIEISFLKEYFDAQFKIKDLGILHYFLSMELLCLLEGVIVNQRKYT